MPPLSDEYIRSLEPETLRYDVTIFDDFVISVLPNGIKTWAFLYHYEGRKRRKTLGVYPDMSYAQAEDALDNVRGMIAKLGGDIKDSAVEDDMPVVTVPERAKLPPKPEQRPAVLAGGLRKHGTGRKRKHKRMSIRLPMRWVKRIGIGVLAAGAVVAIALIVPRLDLFSGSSDTPASPAVTDTAAAPERARPKPIILGDGPAGTESPPAPEGSGTTPGRAAPKPIVLDDPAPAEPQKPDTQSSAVSDRPKPGATAASPGAVARPAPTTTASAPREILASLNDAVSVHADAVAPGRPLPIADKPDPPRVAASTEPANTAAAEPAPSPAPTVTSITSPIATDATATGGEVSRAIVTSNVVDLEPVDDLGQGVTLDNGGYQTIFYFTELRNFSAGQIVHRWIHNGRVIADVPLRVGGGWRWRTYSSKDLLPGLTGDWRVEVVDGDGRVLGQRHFRFDR